MRKERKIIVFVVEGRTDMNALLSIQRLYRQAHVHFHIVRGDVTADIDIDDSRLVHVVSAAIMNDKGFHEKRYKVSDILAVFHVMDTDGAYVPDSCVQIGNTLEYLENGIRHPKPASIISRNRRKSMRMTRLAALKKLPIGRRKVEYRCFYFSRNLEHVMHRNADILSETEKRLLSYQIKEEHAAQPEKLRELMCDPELAVPGSYDQTWGFIQQPSLRSLQRWSNFYLVFTEIEAML